MHPRGAELRVGVEPGGAGAAAVATASCTGARHFHVFFASQTVVDACRNFWAGRRTAVAVAGVRREREAASSVVGVVRVVQRRSGRGRERVVSTAPWRGMVVMRVVDEGLHRCAAVGSQPVVSGQVQVVMMVVVVPNKRRMERRSAGRVTTSGTTDAAAAVSVRV